MSFMVVSNGISLTIILLLETSWNIAVRRMYNVDYQTHRNLLPVLAYIH